MPSAYVLAKDRIEQARAMLVNETWFDPQADYLFEILLVRLDELEAGLYGHARMPSASEPTPLGRERRVSLMPWLDP